MAVIIAMNAFHFSEQSQKAKPDIFDKFPLWSVRTENSALFFMDRWKISLCSSLDKLFRLPMQN
jgi:hypothetical protein